MEKRGEGGGKEGERGGVDVHLSTVDGKMNLT